ncbi:helix-turn-helix transcriptional regulator [Pusillimonas sp. SM2304]|uniref:helix-turn-helix domain-containing protein n=1 Tax=Pusillimonas sp. SM2304 TaxID=3073241 RepID=UPI0028754E81|nr:helix-turn-helix transcriptional regulator [Pusillimonas sp. SM2304]MDS1142216.1 helix-turn-helix transcriptional regulator [Pusillimonas sp. SM2304]
MVSVDDYRRLTGMASAAPDNIDKSPAGHAAQPEPAPFADLLTPSALQESKLLSLIEKISQPKTPDAEGYPPQLLSCMLKHNWSSVRAWREHLGFTLTEAATRLGVSEASYRHMERLGEKLPPQTLQAIATAFGTRREYLELGGGAQDPGADDQAAPWPDDESASRCKTDYLYHPAFWTPA